MVRTAKIGLAVALAALLAAPIPAHATFPGENGKIAFVRSAPGPQIWTMNPDGTGESPLTDGREPAWSADGTKIAFVRAHQIWSMNADGTNQVRLTVPFTDFTDSSPAWSPDGGTIAYITTFTDENGSCGHLALIDADGGNYRSPADGCYVNPDWSPDGTKIAVQTDPGFDPVTSYLVTVNPDGTGRSQIATSVTAPSWSPGAVWIAGWRPGDGTHLVAPDGSEDLLLTSNGGTDPVWSPDGTKIAFSRGDLYTMNSGGGEETQLTPGGGQPSWQPLPPAPTYPGHPRPKAAGPMRVSLTVAYNACTSPNEVHGPPLAFDSCSPPTQSSDYLTVGTADSNGQPANSIGYLRFGAHVGDPSTAADEADVRLDASVTDVRCRIDFFPCTGGTLSDYTGVLDAKFDLRITDRYNGGSGKEAGTFEIPVFRLPFHLVVPCSPTAAGDVGSTCAVSTTVDTLVPGTVREGKRAVWEIGEVQVKDGGADGATLDDNTLFLDQGLFIP